MKRRSFLKNSAMAAGAASMTIPVLASRAAASNTKSIFELRVYHISRANNAKNLLEQYFQDALIPFLNKRNVKFGAFNQYSLEEPVKLHVLISYPDPSVYYTTQQEIMTDATYIKASGAYNKIPAAEAVYTRYETFLLEAFENFPSLVIPSEKKHLFELRTYESASEDAGRRKIAMFNNEEIALFLKVGLQPVFFGRILGGQYMPALTYMVGFKDMADRDAAWGKFGSHEDWKKMSAKPEYADTVSNIYKTFLTPADYSQV
jgi:hypothetical protein